MFRSNPKRSKANLVSMTDEVYAAKGAASRRDISHERQRVYRIPEEYIAPKGISQIPKGIYKDPSLRSG